MLAEPLSVESSDPPKAMMAHVLFGDIVGYSKLPTDAQPRVLQRLRQAVRASRVYCSAIESGQLICVATGDGAALVFFDDISAPLRCAVEIASALNQDAELQLRMGVHSGYVFRVADINGKDNVAGGGINIAQRVMDCGDAGHILVSSTHADLLGHFGTWKSHLHDLGELEVKHGVRLRLYNFHDGEAGRLEHPSKVVNPTLNATVSPVIVRPAPKAVSQGNVVIVYKRGAQPDEILLAELEAGLHARGFNVFIDRHLQVGVEWARQIAQKIETANAVVPLLSAAATHSEMLAFELQLADEAAQRHRGRPRILPIRVNWEEPLPPSLAPLLDRFQYAVWHGPEDTGRVLGELTASLASPPEQTPRRRTLEAPTGAVPLDSPFYLERDADEEFLAAVTRSDSIVLLEGARQMGKTSLLSRGLQAARAADARVVCTDFQTLNEADLVSLDAFYLTLGNALADQLDLDRFPEEVWRKERGPNANFERYLRNEVLKKIGVPLVWGLDEVDRLFTCAFASEVFGLFRSWHNARALDPSSPWHRMTQVIAYATEAHLFITDLNQSPFNVGTKIRLRDFTRDEVEELNRRYGRPLPDEGSLASFSELVGGQPFLVRRGLHELASRRISVDQLHQTATNDDGPFGDHLKRFLVLLTRDAALLQAVREVLASRRFPEVRLFQRLRAAGLVLGESPSEARFRCPIYERYLSQHLR